MTFMWDSEPVVAPSDFCPFTKEVAMPEPMPVAGRDASTRVRKAAGPGARAGDMVVSRNMAWVTRPAGMGLS